MLKDKNNHNNEVINTCKKNTKKTSKNIIQTIIVFLANPQFPQQNSSP